MKFVLRSIYFIIVLGYSTTLLRTKQIDFNDFSSIQFKGNPISRFETQFPELKEIISNEKYVGYWSYYGVDTFYMTQYSLSPTLLVPVNQKERHRKKYHFVVGFGLSDNEINIGLKDKKLQIVKNFPGKLCLFQSLSK